MSFLRATYNGMKSVPFLGGLINKVRTSAYAFVSRIVQNHMDETSSRIAHISIRLDECFAGHNANSDRINALAERTEFVRLELFYELMHRLKHASLTQADKEDAEVLNQFAYDQAIAQKQIRVNLGCGHKPIEGYLNVDQRALPKVDIRADILDLPFEQNTVQEIFAAHLVEHFTAQSLRTEVLPYWHSLLAPQGVLRLIAPNAQAMIMAYANQKMPFDQLTTVLLGMQEYDGDFHFAMLSPENLTKLLQEAGFADIQLLTDNRENGLCLEMELTARKPVPN
jgi:predicted SAM-dependent methyltransferase